MGLSLAPSGGLGVSLGNQPPSAPGRAWPCRTLQEALPAGKIVQSRVAALVRPWGFLFALMHGRPAPSEAHGEGERSTGSALLALQGGRASSQQGSPAGGLGTNLGSWPVLLLCCPVCTAAVLQAGQPDARSRPVLPGGCQDVTDSSTHRQAGLFSSCVDYAHVLLPGSEAARGEGVGTGFKDPPAPPALLPLIERQECGGGEQLSSRLPVCAGPWTCLPPVPPWLPPTEAVGVRWAGTGAGGSQLKSQFSTAPAPCCPLLPPHTPQGAQSRLCPW